MRRSVCLYLGNRWVHNIGIPKSWAELSEQQRQTIKAVVAKTQMVQEEPTDCPCKMHCRAVGWTEGDLLFNGATVVEALVRTGEPMREEIVDD
jgi:hypothetical protein